MHISVSLSCRALHIPLVALILVLASSSCSAAAFGSARQDLEQGGLLDKRFRPGLARWYIPDDLPDLWTDDHEHPPLTQSEAYGSYVNGPNGIQFWDSHWIRFFYQWVYQMKTSPLRVHSPEAADFIFVPVCLGSWCGSRPTSPLYFRSHTYKWTHSEIDRKTYFFNHAPQLLPWLGKKPHVMVFNGALPGDLQRMTAVNFTFIGLEATPGMDPARFLTAPYPSHEHHDIQDPMPSLGKSQRLGCDQQSMQPCQQQQVSRAEYSMQPPEVPPQLHAWHGAAGGSDEAEMSTPCGLESLSSLQQLCLV